MCWWLTAATPFIENGPLQSGHCDRDPFDGLGVVLERPPVVVVLRLSVTASGSMMRNTGPCRRRSVFLCGPFRWDHAAVCCRLYAVASGGDAMVQGCAQEFVLTHQ